MIALAGVGDRSAPGADATVGDFPPAPDPALVPAGDPALALDAPTEDGIAADFLAGVGDGLDPASARSEWDGFWWRM